MAVGMGGVGLLPLLLLLLLLGAVMLLPATQIHLRLVLMAA
jgi:hypothetical protein